MMPPKPIEDRLCADPPSALADRNADLALYVPNILRIPVDPSPPRLPGDAAPQDPKRWFITSDQKGNHPRVTGGNEVTFLIDGIETYPAMVEAIRTATGPAHFIYLLGWCLYVDFPLTPTGDAHRPAEAGPTIRELFTAKSGQSVPIRAMLWKHTSDASFNVKAVEFINSLPTGAAVFDGRVCSITGSHHQKVLLVCGEEGLIGFCGGIDLNPDRVYPITANGPNSKGDTAGAPYHDVHCMIRGPAVQDLLETFQMRWRDHPEARKWPPLQQKVPPPPRYRSALRQYVQIGRTFGNPSLTTSFSLRHGQRRDAPAPQGIPQVLKYSPLAVPSGPEQLEFRDDRFQFSPHGEQTIRSMIIHGIQTARRFIYMEDQYMVSMEACEELCKRKDHLEHVTILIPKDNITAMGFLSERRWMFADRLKKEMGDKARIFAPKTNFPPLTGASSQNPGDPHTYVHSKMYVFDDEYAIIGSANCNRRSFTNDAEVAAGITDEPIPDSFGLGFAHRLRLALWAEHLGMDPAELIDGVAAAQHWIDPPQSARIEPYEPVAPKPYTPPDPMLLQLLQNQSTGVMDPDLARATEIAAGGQTILDEVIWAEFDPDGT